MSETMRLTRADEVTPDNPVAGDLHLVGGAISWLDGIDAARQAIESRLQAFRGDWFLDLRSGVPYYQTILRKGVDVATVRSAMREAILSVPAVVEVTELTVELDAVTRTARVRFAAVYQDGRPIRSEDYGPIIISG